MKALHFEFEQLTCQNTNCIRYACPAEAESAIGSLGVRECLDKRSMRETEVVVGKSIGILTMGVAWAIGRNVLECQGKLR